jgi:GxxExxY protein
MSGMQIDEGDARLLASVTEPIIGCALRVANTLGRGFVEKVCENALAHELRKSVLATVEQRGIVVFYDGGIVGEYTADLLVQDQTTGRLSDMLLPQCRNDLRATGKPCPC